MADNMNIISSLQIAILEKDFVAQDGSVIPKGTSVVLVPQTLAAAVIVESGKSLAELWSSISRTDHGHEGYANALAGYQKELIQLADRVTRTETDLAMLKSLAASEHGFESTV